ncbi:hypothetical protein NPX13_g752 [Xylaria arbuscula]|uniref:Uncharacterized protein n=1 Tax=Xylaria arbuscula TaxID=114810 RepID=A0A9W8NNE0_9PEZI|nr:hypothetical protein NPX13_g752 [Xylaria arbuscula]
MSQQQDEQVRGALLSSSQESRDDEESYSTKATRGGSSDAGSEDLELSHTRSRSSDHRPHRPVVSSLSQHIQTVQANDSNTTNPIQGTSSRGNDSLIGLSPLSPLPHAMLPTRKRSLEEVLGDESQPAKDKMSAEIDELAREPTSDLPDSSSGSRDVLGARSHQRKKSRSSGGSSIYRAVPVRTRSSASHSEQRRNSGEESRSQRIRNASHHDKQSSSS